MKVFIGCVKTKNKGKLPARRKYKSALFQKELSFAQTLTEDKNIFIVSAKYGLITLDTIIDDYNLTLNNFTREQRKVWSYKVIKKAEEFNIAKGEKIIFLCGKNYSEFLKKYYKNNNDPTQGLSFGKTLQWFNQNIERGNM